MSLPSGRSCTRHDKGEEVSCPTPARRCIIRAWCSWNSYQLRGGVDETDYDTWARQVALPFWQNQQGFRAIRGYYTLVGGGARIVAQVDFDHWDSLATVMASDGYMRQRHELTTFANDIDSRVLVPTGRTPQ